MMYKVAVMLFGMADAACPTPAMDAICLACPAGTPTDGGVALNNGFCIAWCSSPGSVNGNGYCGNTANYKTSGSTDCSQCTPAPTPVPTPPPTSGPTPPQACTGTIKATCMNCPAGVASDGGVPLVNAHCIAWCSAPGSVNGNGYCGSTSNYMGYGSTDCSMCTPAPTSFPTPPPTAPPTPPQACTGTIKATCLNCPQGVASDGGVPLVNGHCIAWCSAPGTVNGNGFCGSTSNYMGTGSTDCSMCTPAPTPAPNPCPNTCQYCPTGIASDGGVADVNGLCREWCSIPSSVNGNGHCGNSNLYTTGTDCRGCTLPCPATCLYCPQGIASDGGVPDINGMCTNFCSIPSSVNGNGHCGTSDLYTPGTDCRACTPVTRVGRVSPDLNNGWWPLHDVNYYRRTVTKNSRVKLMELMGMNETNETELLLVTPLSSAPTTPLITPSPTPVPEEVTIVVALAVSSAAGFDKNAVLVAMGLTSSAEAAAVFVVVAKVVISIEITTVECVTSYANIFKLPAASIKCTITKSGGGRRLASGFTATVEGECEDATTADNANAAAAKDTALGDQLKIQDSVKFVAVETSVTEVLVTAVLSVTEEAKDEETAKTVAALLKSNTEKNMDAIKAAAGATVVVVETPTVVAAPTPMPTKMPTFMPTLLPMGFSFSPTKMPTVPPTNPPTAPPTNPPTAPPTNPPTAPPTNPPTAPPTNPPTAPPTNPPTAPPTNPPTAPPTNKPTAMPTPVPPTSAPTMSPTNASTEEESGANLKSAGMLTAAAVAFATSVAMQ